jgi:hypothetical protein
VSKESGLNTSKVTTYSTTNPVWLSIDRRVHVWRRNIKKPEEKRKTSLNCILYVIE